MACCGVNLLLVNYGDATVAHAALDNEEPARITFADSDNLDFFIRARRDLIALCGNPDAVIFGKEAT
jgi:hypothetical protein